MSSNQKNKFQLIIGGGLKFSVSEEEGISFQILKPDFAKPNQTSDRIMLQAPANQKSASPSPSYSASASTPGPGLNARVPDSLGAPSPKGSLLDIYC